MVQVSDFLIVCIRRVFVYKQFSHKQNLEFPGYSALGLGPEPRFVEAKLSHYVKVPGDYW